MFQKDFSLPLRSHILGDYIVINQTSFPKYPNLFYSTDNKKFISTRDRGLSNSRNLAIDNSNADICLLADDDLYYYDNYVAIVESSYKKYPNADVILFDIDEDDDSPRRRKKVQNREGRMNMISVLRGNSVRISFKLSSINKKGIRFNTLFGAGSKYFTSGEDNIFLIDCLRSGLNVYYVPVSILKLRNDDDSSWFEGFNSQYFMTKGAFAYYYLGSFWWLYILYLSLRHLKRSSREVSYVQLFKSAYEGVALFKQLTRN